MRPVFADPKTDFDFKRIFGSEVHKPLLIELLNALELEGDHRIVRGDEVQGGGEFYPTPPPPWRGGEIPKRRLLFPGDTPNHVRQGELHEIRTPTRGGPLQPGLGTARLLDHRAGDVGPRAGGGSGLR